MTTYNTGNPVGSVDPKDLYDNAQNLDNIVNGSEHSYADRLGVARRSLAGIDAAADAVLSGLGYAPPVTYAAGISLTLTTQTVEYNGEVYAPKSSALPFTTGGAFDPTKFRLIQGVAASELAAPGGSALVGFHQSGTGAVARTAQSKLREVSSVLDFGADPSGTADSTTAFQKALDAGSVFIPDGTYIVSSVNVTAHGRSIYGQSKGAILKRKALTYLPLIVCDGFNDFRAENFKVDGNKAGSPLTGSWTPSGGGADIAENEQGDIVCRNGSNAMIEKVSFVNSLTSPALLYKMTSSNIIGCSSYGHQREGFYIISGRGNRIARCDSRGDAVQPWSLIATTGLAADAEPHYHIVEDNYCYDSQAAFVTINTTYTKVRHNVIGKLLGLASTGPGIRLGHDLPGQSAGFADVHNNRVFGIADSGSGGTGRGISIENAPSSDVHENTVNGCRVGVGSGLTNNTGASIRDNIADSCTSVGFDIYFTMNPRVLRNVARSCPTGFNLSCQGMYAADNYAIGSATWGFSVVGTSGLNSANTFENNRTDSTTPNRWNVTSPGGQTFVNNEYGTNQQASTTISGAVPSVASGNLFVVDNAAATNMTAMGNWKEGAIYTLFFANSNTTLKQSGSFRLKGGVDVVPSVGKVLQVLASGSLFYEVGRSF